ncbi:hypothetical protein EXE59_06085 [Nocardioides eburneiflavus]|uniref:Uncharacterized protein n=1 Tax=Nocardioides eburneiflavus TaxID=2518372 RepID=A0A4Z1C0F5_9ACTN|nr:hypothetical protein EXE59_06085 [Nocardioides eburneiflavus]
MPGNVRSRWSRPRVAAQPPFPATPGRRRRRRRASWGACGPRSNFGPAYTDVLLHRSRCDRRRGHCGWVREHGNYVALSEPWVTIGSSVNGTSIRQSPWVFDVSAS